MFYITNKKGFHIEFSNGWRVSVQFGPGNYCDNYSLRIGRDEEQAGESGSATAECAVMDPDGELFAHPSFGGDTVSNRSSPAEVLELMKWAAAQNVKSTTNEGTG